MPRLTLVIASHEMPTQVRNTLQSVLPPYQRGIAASDVHVVLIDNGSSSPLPRGELPAGVEYVYVAPDAAAPYPGPAINEAVRTAPTEAVGVMIDGARLLTPGVLQGALDVLDRWHDVVVDVKGWHLGDAPQQDQLAAGLDPGVDQELLADVDWVVDGYRLFDICAPTYSTRDGFLAPTNESTGLFTHRELFLGVGGYDPRFRTPGGGLANIDLWYRLVAAASTVVTLLGEGTFHQAHGGASTGMARPRLAAAFPTWRAELEHLTGRRDVEAPAHDPLLVGRLGPAARRVQAAAILEEHA